MINNLKIYNMKTNDNNLFDSKLGKLHKAELLLQINHPI